MRSAIKSHPLTHLFTLPLLALLGASSTALAGSSDDYAILAGTAVTCTDSTIDGDIAAGTAYTETRCDVSGAVHLADAAAKEAYVDFLGVYDDLGSLACDQVLTGTLAGVSLLPGVYCFDAAATLTGTLTLRGSGSWTFLIGTGGTGALTATNFSMEFDGGGEGCDVEWWVAQAATLTTSDFIGTIYAGADITVTGGTYEGDALAGGGGSAALPTGAVTLTGASLDACDASSPGNNGNDHGQCNQGVGNGPEECDPGNSNQGDPTRSNDEVGGTPGNPGRKGGNGK